MKRHILPLCIGALFLIASATPVKEGEPVTPDQEMVSVDSCCLLYEGLGLEGKINEEIFRTAFNGYQQIEGRKRDVLTLIDFTKPSNEKRLYVIDMKQKKLLFESVVAHGRGSGELYATAFSNKPNSHQSSLGFYLTAETYQGNNGYSLRLDGLESGLNDNARSRAIVIHGARYANPTVCHGGNRLGRSFGCPALPEALNKPIIDAIKGGSLLFIYAEDPTYLAKSRLIEPHTTSTAS